jgi:predicted DNA-binding protein (MmcQ/YjbR family)
MEELMNVKRAIEYCLSKKGARETYPFDETTLVFKVGSKMFGLIYDRQGDKGLNLKCNPDLNLELRQQYEGIIPAYHMNKRHWSTVVFDRDVPDEMILKLIDNSYETVFNSLTKKNQKEILEEK